MPGRVARAIGWVAVVAIVGVGAACSPRPDPSAERVTVTIPRGATFAEVLDTLTARGVVTSPRFFTLHARLQGADARIRAGRYEFPLAAPWDSILDPLTRGRVLTDPLTIPEGWVLAQIAGRIAAFTNDDSVAVDALLRAEDAVERLEVPGPTLEGYLLPETYRFAGGTSAADIIAAMVGQYRAFWTPERRARLDELGMDERELVTLASIVQAEARHFDEMPRIAGVYHNRLREGWLLQADPTVLYALGGTRSRLLFAAIDSVADSPYNTYTQPGLPPGPIGAPGSAALSAALEPEAHAFMFFVATPDGRHVFTRTLAEHNRAVAEARRAAREPRP